MTTARWAAKMLLLGSLAVKAEDLIIQSFDHHGAITFNEISNATQYRVEWSSGAGGAWTNSWDSLNAIPPNGSGTITASVPMWYRVVATLSSPTPSDMVLVPAGSFVMGDSLADGSSDELPAHSVYVSAFYIDPYETRKALWDEVYTWAVSHGYTFDNAGSVKGANHPVNGLNWYDCVKWCNARSEKEGKPPAYFTSAALTTVYRTGTVRGQNDWVRWDAGYRLPTEAEWEKAARGGASGQRFPWSDSGTIQHARANYSSSTTYSYDTSPTRGYHPTYNDGVLPYTSPCGAFAANGYGLYDMAGNLAEWCWDRYSSSYYSVSPGNDPRGPDSGTSGVNRGNRWSSTAYECRAAERAPVTWTIADYRGFRCVLPVAP